MMKLLHHITTCLLAAMLLSLMAACENAVFDDQGDCDPVYRLRLSYTRNMKWADAFPAEVTHVGVYAFNAANGSLAWHGTEDAAKLIADDCCMNLPLTPGTYDIIVWCGGKSRQTQAAGWTLAGGDNITTKADLLISLAALRNGNAIESSSDLHRLYHGSLTAAVMPEKEGVHEYEIDLTKDTNFIRVILQHADGDPVNPSWFTFTITDHNSALDHTNASVSDETVIYKPWAVTSAETEMPDPDNIVPGTAGKSAAGSRAISQISSAIADFTTSRLVMGNRPTIDIRCIEPGNEHLVASLDLISYFLMIKGTANRHVDDQDFLDRQDDYAMMLILDDNNKWNLGLGLYINSWRIVKQNEIL